MKKQITTGIFAAICSLSFMTFSCKTDSETIKLQPGSQAEFQALRDKALASLIQTKTFKAEEGITFTSNKGAKVTIQPNCLTDENFVHTTGEVKLSFVEMYDKGDMVVTNKPVMGLDYNGDKLPLVTGGQYNIEITQGNKKLRTGCIFNVSIPAKNTGELDENMVLWKGNINENGDMEWENEVREAGDKEEGMQGNKETSTYNVWGSSFGWTNVDRFYSDTRPKTRIKVTVPTGYSNKNSAVYLAYEGQRNVLAQLDTYDLDEKYFSEHYGFIPVGLKVHVIFVSESNGSVVYAIKPVTIANNSTIQINDNDLDTGSLTQVITRINTLN